MSFDLIHSAYAASVENTTFEGLVTAITTGIIDPLIAFLFVLATVIFLWGVVRYVIGGGQSEVATVKGRKAMLWGIIGMFVMATAWGIVKLLCDFFGTCQHIVF